LHCNALIQFGASLSPSAGRWLAAAEPSCSLCSVLVSCAGGTVVAGRTCAR